MQSSRPLLLLLRQSPQFLQHFHALKLSAATFLDFEGLLRFVGKASG